MAYDLQEQESIDQMKAWWDRSFYSAYLVQQE